METRSNVLYNFKSIVMYDAHVKYYKHLKQYHEILLKDIASKMGTKRGIAASKMTVSHVKTTTIA